MKHYRKDYRWNNGVSVLFSFPCNKKGKVLVDQLDDNGKETYIRCLDGTFPVTCMGTFLYDGDCQVWTGPFLPQQIEPQEK